MSLPLLMVVYQLLTDSVPFMNGAYRLVGPYLSPSPVGFSLYLLFIALLIYGLSLRRIHLMGGLLFALCVALLYMTHTRGAYMGLLIGMLAIDLLTRRWHRVWLLLITSPLAILLLPSLFSRFVGLVQLVQTGTVTTDFSLLTRLNLQTTMWPYVRQSPLWGNGLGSFARIFEQLTSIPKVAPHNDYLYFAVETGALGVLTYLYFQLGLLGLLWGRLKRMAIETRALPATALTIFGVINVLLFFENAIFFTGVQIYIMSLVALALNDVTRP